MLGPCDVAVAQSLFDSWSDDSVGSQIPHIEQIRFRLSEPSGEGAAAHTKRAKSFEERSMSILDTPDLNLRYLIEYHPSLRKTLAKAMEASAYLDRKASALGE